jgi:tRNA(Ile)-lysidine synthase
MRDADWPAVAVHIDHQLDPGSGDRAGAAAGLAQELGVPMHLERLSRADWRRGESLEAGARRLRYAALEASADRLGAGWILTAHHLEDQAETVLLRLLFGSGLAGLAAIQERRGRLLRPFLDLPRRALRAGVAEAGLEAVDDPTNEDLRRPRNRLRHRVLPELRRQDPSIDRRLADLARAAFGARNHLPAATREKHLAPLMAVAANLTAPFSYTFDVPGSISLQSLGLRLSVELSSWQPWMADGDARETGLALPASTGRATVRSRRPGDRLRPLGAPGERKLKELLIDRKVPRSERDRLPLLEIEGRLAWVPGVTIAEAFRCVPGAPVWRARLEAE